MAIDKEVILGIHLGQILHLVGSPTPHRLLERCTYGTVQSGVLFVSQLTRHPHRVDTGMKEGLGCLNVPQTGNPMLIHQERLDRQSSRFEKLGEPARREPPVESVNSEPGEGLADPPVDDLKSSETTVIT